MYTLLINECGLSLKDCGANQIAGHYIGNQYVFRFLLGVKQSEQSARLLAEYTPIAKDIITTISEIHQDKSLALLHLKSSMDIVREYAKAVLKYKDLKLQIHMWRYIPTQTISDPTYWEKTFTKCHIIRIKSLEKVRLDVYNFEDSLKED